MLTHRCHANATSRRERNVISGSAISAKQVYEVKPGDLVYNRLFAWKRSFGLAASEIAGGTVSNEFPTFVVDADRVAPRYLLSQLLGRDFTDAVNGASTGSTPTSRNRLKEQEFLRLEVPVPSMSRQGQAVAYLTALDKVARLREGARLIIDALLPAARNEISARWCDAGPAVAGDDHMIEEPQAHRF